MSCKCKRWKEFVECKDKLQNEGIRQWVGQALGYEQQPLTLSDFMLHYKKAIQQNNQSVADNLFAECYKKHGDKCNQLLNSKQGYYQPGSFGGTHSAIAVPGRGDWQ